MRYSSRFFLYGPFLMFVALAAGVMIYWWISASALSQRLDALNGREIAHTGPLTLEIVPTMHDRKARIHELSDAFIVLPGGFGTFEELLETVTWAQIGLHAKPCILINTANYWNGLLAFLDTAVAAGFIEVRSRQLLRVAANAADALTMVAGKT